MIKKKCLYCDEVFDAKKDTAKYCSDSCRVMWNRKNKGNPKPEKIITEKANNAMLADLVEKMDMLLSGKINFTSTPSNGFDATTINRITHDETSQWQEPKRTPLKRTPAHWVELKHECQDADDLAKWVEDLENDTFLTRDEKLLIKHTT